MVRKSELGLAPGIYNIIRFISGTIGVNVMGLIIEGGRVNWAAPMRPFQVGFIVLAAVAAAGTLLALGMPRAPLPVEAAEAPAV